MAVFGWIAVITKRERERERERDGANPPRWQDLTRSTNFSLDDHVGSSAEQCNVKRYTAAGFPIVRLNRLLIVCK